MSERKVSVQTDRDETISESRIRRQRKESESDGKSSVENHQQWSQTIVHTKGNLLTTVAEGRRKPSDARRPSRISSIYQPRPSLVPTRLSNARRPSSFWPSTHLMAVVHYENTFQLGPTDGQRFPSNKVEQMSSELLKSFLDGEQYDPMKCRHLSQYISDMIKARIRDLGDFRHKIVCIVHIGQVGCLTASFSSRCLWDRETDCQSSATYQNNSLFACATVFALYYE